MQYYIGIDIGKYQLEVYYEHQSFQVSYDKKGLKILIAHLDQFVKNKKDNCLIVCEATGGYERLLVKQMRNCHYLIHVAHPNKIKAFAKSKGLLAKTDKLDARLIANYAQVMQVGPDSDLSIPAAEKISELIKRREQLMADKLREQARLDKEYDRVIKQSIQSHIRWLEKEIAHMGELLEQQSQQADIQPQLHLLTSIPAIGQLSALTLIAFLPELGQAEHQQLAALVGVAPFNRDSGRYQGKRFIHGGRAMVRKSLYMAAVASLRWNPALAHFYQRLRSRGKSAKVALVAVMRKLLGIINSIMKRQTPWQEKLNPQA